MARYHGQIGFAVPTETRPGVWTNDIVALSYSGDVIKDTHKWQSTEHLNDDFTISNQISVVSDIYALENMQHIRYVTWMGSKWKVTSIEVKRPRLIMSIGGIYNE